MITKTKALISISLLGLLSLTCVADTSCPVDYINKCIDDLGCFCTGPPFYDPILRPVSLPPMDPENINTRFLLYTPTQEDQSYQLDSTQESLDASTYDEALPTKFLIHGYLRPLESGDAINRLKDAFLEEGDYNVIIVDWTGGNGPPYTQAVANARVVGAQIAQLVEFLQSTRGVEAQSVHIIGYSLGAHVAGYAGERIPTLGRISGLDPAGPFFTGTTEEVRLDPSDADFVDNIHSNMGGALVNEFASPDPMGDLDFYPNDDEDRPLCDQTLLENLVYGDEEAFYAAVPSCDHSIGEELYIESINSQNCEFIGTKCESYEAYEDGSCENNAQAVMGYPSEMIADVTPGVDKFYLDINATPPYCIPAGGP